MINNFRKLDQVKYFVCEYNWKMIHASEVQLIQRIDKLIRNNMQIFFGYIEMKV